MGWHIKNNITSWIFGKNIFSDHFNHSGAQKWPFLAIWKKSVFSISANFREVWLVESLSPMYLDWWIMLLRFAKWCHFFSCQYLQNIFSFFKTFFPRPFFGVIVVKMCIFYYVSCFSLQWRFQNRVNHFSKWNLGGFRNKIEMIKMIIILCKTQSYQLPEATNPLKITSMKYFFHYWSPLMIYLKKIYPSVKNLACQKVTFFHPWTHCVMSLHATSSPYKESSSFLHVLSLQKYHCMQNPTKQTFCSTSS